MARSDPKIHERNRRANRDAAVHNAHLLAVTQWLRDNPQIGSLNGGKYYKIVDGKTVSVKELGE